MSATDISEEHKLFCEMLSYAKEMSMEQFKEACAQLSTSPRMMALASHTAFPEAAREHVETVLSRISMPSKGSSI